MDYPKPPNGWGDARLFHSDCSSESNLKQKLAVLACTKGGTQKTAYMLCLHYVSMHLVLLLHQQHQGLPSLSSLYLHIYYYYYLFIYIFSHLAVQASSSLTYCLYVSR